MTRWILAGCPARDGTRVKLKATRAGSRWLIDPADLEEFFRLLAAEPVSAPSPPTTPVTNEKASERTLAASESLIRRGA